MSVRLLFDTSVWIDFLNQRNIQSANLLEKNILDDEQVFLTPTILQEILQGIRDDSKYEQIKETLSYFTYCSCLIYRQQLLQPNYIAA